MKQAREASVPRYQVCVLTPSSRGEILGYIWSIFIDFQWFSRQNQGFPWFSVHELILSDFRVSRLCALCRARYCIKDPNSVFVGLAHTFMVSLHFAFSAKIFYFFGIFIFSMHLTGFFSEAHFSATDRRGSARFACPDCARSAGRANS